jgi:hypothetical protein
MQVASPSKQLGISREAASTGTTKALKITSAGHQRLAWNHMHFEFDSIAPLIAWRTAQKLRLAPGSP